MKRTITVTLTDAQHRALMDACTARDYELEVQGEEGWLVGTERRVLANARGKLARAWHQDTNTTTGGPR